MFACQKQELNLRALNTGARIIEAGQNRYEITNIIDRSFVSAFGMAGLMARGVIRKPFRGSPSSIRPAGRTRLPVSMTLLLATKDLLLRWIDVSL